MRFVTNNLLLKYSLYGHISPFHHYSHFPFKAFQKYYKISISVQNWSFLHWLSRIVFFSNLLFLILGILPPVVWRSNVGSRSSSWCKSNGNVKGVRGDAALPYCPMPYRQNNNIRRIRTSAGGRGGLDTESRNHSHCP